MPDGTPAKLLETIAKRVRVLECIHTGIDERRAIADKINVSRQTVSRALEDLERKKIIKDKYDDGYQITLRGGLAYQEFDKLRTSYKWLLEAGEMLVHVPSEIPIDMRMLHDADTLISDEQVPQQPFHEVVDMAQSADDLRSFFPVVLPCYVNFCHTQIVERGIEVEVLLDEDVLPAVSCTYKEKFRGCVQADNCAMWRTSEGLPFTPGIIDNETVWVGIHQNGGGLHGAIINNRDSAVDWAAELFERYRENAEKVLLCDVGE